MIELQDWQKPLAAKMADVLRRQRMFLCSATTGAGKTYLASAVARELGMPTLVVCPKIAISQWKSVIAGMGVGDGVIGVINPENLITSKRNPFYSHDGGWRNVPEGPALLIFDEMHRGAGGIYKLPKAGGKGSGNKQALMAARWVNRSTPEHKFLALTATPADSPMKMQALGYLMGFHSFVAPSFYDWCRRHGCSMQARGRQAAFAFTRDRLRAKAIMEGIRKDMGERFMSITPEEIPGFPEETREVVLVDLAKEDYEGLVQAYAEMPELMKKPSRDSMVKLLRLRQQAEFCKASVLAGMAGDEEQDGNSIFICLNFTDARLRVQAELERAGVQFASIYGGQNERERQAGIAAFQANEVHVMVGMSSACGVALSLHDERHERPRVSLISPSYSASELVQALGRIRRVGGTHATQKIVLAAGSVEENVAKAVSGKVNNIGALTDADLSRGLQ
jgi:superfamily II DNA or RNA helicase